MEFEFLKGYLGLILPILIYSGLLVTNPALLNLHIIFLFVLLILFKQIWDWFTKKGISDFVLAGIVGLYLSFAMNLLFEQEIMKILFGAFYLAVALILMQTYFSELRSYLDEKLKT